MSGRAGGFAFSSSPTEVGWMQGRHCAFVYAVLKTIKQWHIVWQWVGEDGRPGWPSTTTMMCCGLYGSLKKKIGQNENFSQQKPTVRIGIEYTLFLLQKFEDIQFKNFYKELDCRLNKHRPSLSL